ncbi:MAG: hypothetical protein AAF125_00075 [Chloroflexota bacterium]
MTAYGSLHIIITGPYASGKTTLMRSLCGLPPAPPESNQIVRPWVPHAQWKPQVMIHPIAWAALSPDLAVWCLETPGARRFDYMWQTFAEHRLGFIITLDSAKPETFRECKSILETFRAYDPVPHVVAATRADHPDAWSVEDLDLALRLNGSVPIIPVDARQRVDVIPVANLLAGMI